MSNIEEIFNHDSKSGSKGSLGIDENGQLYWNGKAVVTKQVRADSQSDGFTASQNDGQTQ